MDDLVRVMPARDQILTTLKRVLIDDLDIGIPIEEIATDQGLARELGVDSIGFIELRFQCENRFDVSIPDADFTPDHFSTLDALTDYLAARITI